MARRTGHPDDACALPTKTGHVRPPAARSPRERGDLGLPDRPSCDQRADRPRVHGRRPSRRRLNGGGAPIAAKAPRVQLPRPVLPANSRGSQVRLAPCTRAEQRQSLVAVHLSPLPPNGDRHGRTEESLKPSARCGLRLKAFQIRPTDDFDSPQRSAIFARLQWVAFFGVDSSVAITTSSTWSAVMDRSRPGRASSTSPSRRCSTNRARHLPTVALEHRRSAATLLLSAPSAHASTMRERNASDCVDFARRVHRSSCSRSWSSRINGAFGRPVLAIPQATTYHTLLWRRTLDDLFLRSVVVGGQGPGGGRAGDAVVPDGGGQGK